jgi:hypothetical protein
LCDRKWIISVILNFKIYIMQKNLILLFFLSILVVSCSKEETNDIPTATSSSFSYKVDGRQENIKGGNTYVHVFSDESYGIYGLSSDGTGEKCYILVPKNTALGQHVIKSDIKAYYINKNEETFITVFAEGGTLNIEQKDDVHVKGTFSFVAGDGNTPSKKVNVTEGTFNVRIR